MKAMNDIEIMKKALHERLDNLFEKLHELAGDETKHERDKESMGE